MSATPSQQAELQALLTACAVVERADVGRLFITGEDALDLLNRLTTNKLEELPQGQATSTIITNADGRVVDLLALAALDDGLWCLTSPGYAQAVIDWLDTFTFAEEITVVDRSSDTFLLSLAGPAAASVVAALAPGLADLALDAAVRSRLAGADVIVWRRLAGGADGYEVVGEIGNRDAVLAELAKAGAQVASPEAWETRRVLNGMPVMDAEFGLFNNPLEARLLGSISETKGCYTGQEVLARLQTYNKVQRRLMAIDLDALVEPGAKLVGTDGKGAGQVTSVAETPDGVRGLALVTTRLAVGEATLAVDATGATATLHEPAYALATEPVED
jgi:tRNA-modifying protein YgfZ